ncbi:MAG: response regulator [Planctomycetes bacterium]|nr:response regulator [Planctomycetota bacterium]
MAKPLRVLLVEDSENDAMLVLGELRADGFEPAWERVETAGDMGAALDGGSWDVILSDVQMPGFSGFEALSLWKQSGIDIPFIIVSGTVGEDVAVRAMKQGASDYLLKGQLRRLPAAIERELREAADRRERRNVEEQLRHLQKLDSIGRLAGGVAHDFNNLLSAIIGFADLTLDGLHKDDPFRSYVEEIRRAGDRAAALTRQLLAFSRKQLVVPKVLDLNSIVGGMDRLLRRVIGEDVDLVTSLAPGLGRVKADPGQIEQVLMNLATNARDAMPKGGRLTIETADVDLDEAYARRHGAVRPGPHVMLAVTDTGCGMDQETQSHLFEPFFTTKGEGHGTGLGLATAYGIVKQSAGNIWVYSEPGRGATFKIYLPRVDAPLDTQAPAGAPSRPLLQGSETILVAEDEPQVRHLTCHVLKMHGYTVLEARHGGEAVAVAEAHRDVIHLLLSDVVMPEMDGRELAERLAVSRPETRVLFLSGYASNAIVHHGVLDAGIAFLQKPFTPAALAGKVREVLDAPAGERPRKR